MEIAAFVLATFALLIAVFLALAMMEVIANGTAVASPTGTAEDDLIYPYELPERVLGGHLVEDLGLPERHLSDGYSILLVLSPRCKECNALAESIDFDGLPDLTFVVSSSPADVMEEWASQKSLPLERTSLDVDGSLVSQLGVSASPVAIGLLDGRVSFASFTNGPGALRTLLEEREVFEMSVQSSQAALSGDMSALADLRARQMEILQGDHHD